MSGLIKTDPKLIYVAGPISNGDTVSNKALLENVDKAIMVGTQILMLGHIPFIPHLSHFWNERMISWRNDPNWAHMPIIVPSHQDWLDMDFRIIDICDALFRMEGASKGADMEMDYCKNSGKQVLIGWSTLVEWLYSFDEDR